MDAIQPKWMALLKQGVHHRQGSMHAFGTNMNTRLLDALHDTYPLIFPERRISGGAMCDDRWYSTH